jgi:hypothetical protein
LDLVTKLVRLSAVAANRDDVGEKHGVARASLRDKLTGLTGRDFQVEDVGGLAIVEDEENLGQVALACGRFKFNDLVDARFQ